MTEAAILAALYFGLAKLGMLVGVAHGNVSPVWPATGLTIAAMVLRGYRVWPAFWLGTFLAVVTTGAPVLAASGAAIANTLEPIAAVWLLRRYVGHGFPFDRLAHALKYVLLAGVTAPAVSATLGVGAMCWAGVGEWSAYWSLWSTWWLGDLMGALIVAPALLVWIGQLSTRWTRSQLIEATCIMLALTIVSAATFGLTTNTLFAHTYPLTFLTIPIILWAAVRFDLRGATIAILVAATVAIWSTSQGFGPFDTGSTKESLMLLQTYLAVVAVTALVFAAVIGEQKRIEKHLKATQDYLQSIIDNTSDLVCTVDLEGRFRSINQSVTKQLGYTEQDLIGKPKVALAAEPEQFERAFQEVMTKNSLSNLEMQFKRKDGSVADVLYSVSLLRDKSGHPVAIAALGKDITERNQVQELLKVRARQQAVIAEMGLDALGGMDVDELMDRVVHEVAGTLVVEYSKVLELLPDGEALILRAGVGWKDGLVGHATVPATNDSQAGYTLQRKEPVIVEDLRSETRFHGPSLLVDHHVVSGMSVVIEGPVRPFGVLGAHTSRRRTFGEDDAHFLQAMANLLSDAIERRRNEIALRELNVSLEKRVAERTARLEEVNAELEGFAHSVTHDLRAPLRAIEGFGRALVEDHADRLDAEGQELARRIVASASRMDGLVEDVLAYSRLAHTEIHLQSVDLTWVVEQSLSDLDPEIQASQAQVVVQGCLPPVRGHRATLVQIVTNLLSNAVKFVAKDVRPRVKVSAETRNDWVRLYIEDNGVGIPPREHERIFNVFERLHGRETYPGTGIGLAIVRRAAARLGGRLGLESAEGKGSKFWVEFPAADREQASVHSTPRSSSWRH